MYKIAGFFHPEGVYLNNRAYFQERLNAMGDSLKKNGKGHRQKGADHAVNHQPLQRKKDPGQQRKEQQLMAGNKRME